MSAFQSLPSGNVYFLFGVFYKHIFEFIVSFCKIGDAGEEAGDVGHMGHVGQL